MAFPQRRELFLLPQPFGVLFFHENTFFLGLQGVFSLRPGASLIEFDRQVFGWRRPTLPKQRRFTGSPFSEQSHPAFFSRVEFCRIKPDYGELAPLRESSPAAGNFFFRGRCPFRLRHTLFPPRLVNHIKVSLAAKPPPPLERLFLQSVSNAPPLSTRLMHLFGFHKDGRRDPLFGRPLPTFRSFGEVVCAPQAAPCSRSRSCRLPVRL